MISASHVNKVLVIKLRAIGDVLLSTVVLENLRSAFPHATIDFLTERMSADVVTGNKHLSSVIVFDPAKEGGFGLVSKVRKRRYDLVLDLFGNPRSALVTYFSGAAVRVGYRFKWRQYCYNVVVEPRGGDVHNTEFNLDALGAIHVPIHSRSISFPVDEGTKIFAERFFVDENLHEQFVVALNIGGGWYTKRWKLDHFAEFGDLVANRFNAKIVIVWGPGEQHDAETLRRHMKSPSVLIPQTTLKQLAAILERCSVVVTNDSGPMHIAAAMHTPVLAIFGPTNPELQGPFGTMHEIVQNSKITCLGCNFTSCPIGNPCMEELSALSVFEIFSKFVYHHQLVNEPSRVI